MKTTWENYLNAPDSETRMEIVRKAFKAIREQGKYIELLEQELFDTVPLASHMGWKSHRYEQGKKFRVKIKRLGL